MRYTNYNNHPESHFIELSGIIILLMAQQQIFGRVWSSCGAEVTLTRYPGQVVAAELNQACSEEIFLSPAGHAE